MIPQKSGLTSTRIQVQKKSISHHLKHNGIVSFYVRLHWLDYKLPDFTLEIRDSFNSINFKEYDLISYEEPPKFRTKIYHDIVHCSRFKVPHTILSTFKNELNIEFRDNRKEIKANNSKLKTDYGEMNSRCKIHIVYFKLS